MWLKCVLVQYSQPLTSIFGLVNSRIKKMRLDCRLHPSHSMLTSHPRENSLLSINTIFISSFFRFINVQMVTWSVKSAGAVSVTTIKTGAVKSVQSATLYWRKVSSQEIRFWKILQRNISVKLIENDSMHGNSRK